MILDLDIFLYNLSPLYQLKYTNSIKITAT